jgi:hypothetical protein
VTWENIAPRAGERIGNGGVTVAWRRVSNRGTLVLAVTLGSAACEALGFKKGQRATVQRDRIGGKLRVTPSADEGWKAAWKESAGATCAVLHIPLDDLTLTERKPAQAVKWEVEGNSIVLKLPPWACPIVRVNVSGRAA